MLSKCVERPGGLGHAVNGPETLTTRKYWLIKKEGLQAN
jgi:hypothetical protein